VVVGKEVEDGEERGGGVGGENGGGVSGVYGDQRKEEETLLVALSWLQKARKKKKEK